jgi:hypothetical protein
MRHTEIFEQSRFDSMELYFQAKISSQTVILTVSHGGVPLVRVKTSSWRVSLILYPASPILMHH